MLELQHAEQIPSSRLSCHYSRGSLIKSWANSRLRNLGRLKSTFNLSCISRFLKRSFRRPES